MIRATPTGCPSLYLLALLAASALPAAASAQAARVDKFDGALLQRLPGQPWRPLTAGAAIPEGALLLALPQAELFSPNGTVKVYLLADLGHRTLFPVLETALTLHTPDDKVDLDLTLDRGIVGVGNYKKQGAARVRIRFRDQRWLLTLKTPDTRVGIEIYSRHAPGLRQSIEEKDEPVTSVLFLTTKGKAFVDLGEQGYVLDAPPGNALLMWDTLTRTVEFEYLDKAPRSLRDMNEKEADLFKQICASSKRIAEGAIPADAARMLAAPEKTERLVAVTALGALDDLPHLLDALADAKHADVREQAVLVLRHWLGRAPGQTERLDKALRQHGYSEPQARTLLQLLFGFNDAERRQPGTYDLLLSYLDHSKLAVRQLAHWHLVRLAPAGRSINYDPAASAEERAPALRAWRGVIPEGGLPRAPATTKTP